MGPQVVCPLGVVRRWCIDFSYGADLAAPHCRMRATTFGAGCLVGRTPPGNRFSDPVLISTGLVAQRWHG